MMTEENMFLWRMYAIQILFNAIMCELNRKKLVNLSKFIQIVLSNFIKPLR